ncbi:MAG TPA: hypothetical protein VFK50_07050 [Sphingomicrobium sp.]|nr:hypothetical protein [Sphingomicrobium sp.]
MGAPVSQVKAADAASAESLLESFRSIDAAERRRHASVLNYWLSIRGENDIAPIRDLDPLEISDAGPDSLLLELIGGGEDAEIKHSGDALKSHVDVFRISEAPRPSLLASIAGKLAIVAISRNFLAFEDSFDQGGASTRCWITLLPFSSTGVWVDYVYAFVTLSESEAPAAETPVGDAVAAVEEVPQAVAVAEEPAEGPVAEVEPEAMVEPEPETLEPETAAEIAPEPEPEVAPEVEELTDKRPGFSKLFDALTGFHGTNVRAEPKLPAAPFVNEERVSGQEEAPLELDAQFEPAAQPESPVEVAIESEIKAVPEEPADQAAPELVHHAAEGQLQSKLEEVRAKADEARLAKLRSNLALYEGLGAAYDFALDAEGSPEEYLRLVEAKGLKIQLRSPMTPVVKLAFDGMCDDSMIGQLEAVLAWALKNDLPRGSLAETIEAAGGIAPLLNGQAQAA